MLQPGRCHRLARAVNHPGTQHMVMQVSAQFAPLDHTFHPCRRQHLRISAADGAGILAGVEQSGAGIETTYQIQVLFAVPPADAPEGAQIEVVGYTQSLLDAKEIS